MDPLALLHHLLEIEQSMGRVRTVRNGPRTLDLDILLFGDRIVDDPGLEIPHPRLHERSFVLAPAAEIAGEMVHPRMSVSISSLAAAAGPDGILERIEDRDWCHAIGHLQGGV